MTTKVIYVGDDIILDNPIIVSDKDWRIPVGWYLLKNELSDRPIVVYDKDKNPIIINGHIQILYGFDNEEHRMSVIKPDRTMEIGDEIIYNENLPDNLYY